MKPSGAEEKRIGFIQGRLSPLVDGKIQAFPWDCWQDEFLLAQQCGFRIMEWTLDQERLHQNPLLTSEGQVEIRSLCRRYRVEIPTLTGDCFMQAPFFKAPDNIRESLLLDAETIIQACGKVGIGIIVLPLVDNGSIETRDHMEHLMTGLDRLVPLMKAWRVKIAFESDYPPVPLQQFIASLESEHFGINYDIGNSAALGYDYLEEIDAYGERIIGVHIKDRIYKGGTVPLGDGDADLPGALTALQRAGFEGPWILQTARAGNGDHAGALIHYRDMVACWSGGQYGFGS